MIVASTYLLVLRSCESISAAPIASMFIGLWITPIVLAMARYVRQRLIHPVYVSASPHSPRPGTAMGFGKTAMRVFTDGWRRFRLTAIVPAAG